MSQRPPNNNTLMSSEAQLAALRAATIARIVAAQRQAGGAAAGATAAASSVASVSAQAQAQAQAQTQAGTAQPPAQQQGGAAAAAAAAPAPPAEDAVQDGGDAIDTFSTYVPTALPPCLVAALQKRALAVSASASASASAAAASTTSTSGTTESKDEEDDSVIEILDTDNEDSRMSTTVGLPAVPNGDIADKDEDVTMAEATSSSSSSSTSNEDTTLQSIFHPTEGIPSHTSPAVESALLSSVSAPSVPDEAAQTVLELVREGKLSPLQAEGVTLAINRFRRVFTTKGSGRNDAGTRAGFFLGDGAGIGKGRQISATIRDALCRNHGRGRHLWISVSRELVQDARRDLSDVGCHIDVHDGADVLDQMSSGGSNVSAAARKKSKGLGAGGSLGKGVLFITYSLLVSGKRMENIVSWLAGEEDSASSITGDSTGTTKKKASTSPAEAAVERAQRELALREKRARLERSYTGLIVFDEAHKAKNLEQDTRTARLVLVIQDRLPNARVLYCSATGVSDLKHMAYASRLGLWGAANPLYPTFDNFRDALAKRGVGAMETLALEMKRKGVFMARTLSWDGAEFHTLTVKLSKKQIRSYDGAVQWWFNVKEQIEAALELMGISAPKLLWRVYWSSIQRFFREMCIAAKVNDIAKQAQEYMNKNHAIVIGLQTTGEAGMEVALEELADALGETNDAKQIDFEDLEFPNLVSTCASIMSNFVRNHFPIALPPPEMPKVPPIPSAGASDWDKAEYLRISELAERIGIMPDPEPIPELLERRRNMLEAIRLLDLPPNPLDDLIDRLGGVNNVAEMTGRSGRVLKDEKSGMYRYVKRFGGPSKQKSYGLSMPVSREDETDRLNIVEKRKFMQGRKSVAIISDAASTGISLHADRRSEASHKRRVHFTIELPWAADKAIQQLGRSHRSGQTSAPIYKMVVTELGGERRFAAAVSKRMAQLGALTKGDRRAATGTDLSDFDVDSLFGRRALTRLYNNLREPPASAPSRNTNQVLDDFLAIDEIASRFANEDRDETTKRADALQAASEALVDVGLTGEPVVKIFLNRIAALDVARQNLVFNLFMSTLDDVIADAKISGEWEGSVEDVKATSISVKGTPKVIATDASCGADTTLTIIELDRGVSFGQIIETILEDVGDDEKSEENSKKEEEDEDEDSDEQYDPYAPAESGFYRSRRKIAGRHLILFAQRKVVDAEDVDSDFIDPLGNMIVTRPNTGKNPCCVTSRDLKYKYDLLVSSAELVRQLRKDDQKENVDEDEDEECEQEEKKDDERSSTNAFQESADPVSKVRVKIPKVASMWDEAYNSSDHSEHNAGLAPRRSEMGLITGAVLHILPALEKAVAFVRNAQQRSLRVMRVEITGTGQRIVGIKFPIDSLPKLMEVMKDVSAARKGSLDAPSYDDDGFSPIDEKAMSWASTERKTMKSFFGAATSSKPSAPSRSSSALSRSSSLGSAASESSKRKQPTFVSSQAQNSSSKRAKSTGNFQGRKKKKTPQKTLNISSFFTKKG